MARAPDFTGADRRTMQSFTSTETYDPPVKRQGHATAPTANTGMKRRRFVVRAPPGSAAPLRAARTAPIVALLHAATAAAGMLDRRRSGVERAERAALEPLARVALDLLQV